MTLQKARHWLLLALLCIAAPVFAQNVAVVNGTSIPTSYADALTKELVRQGQTDSPELRAAVRDELINRQVLMDEAARLGIPNQPDVKAQLAIAQQSVVIRALMENYLSTHQPTDAQLHQEYDDVVKQMGGKEYHLQHILVDNEQQAKDIIAKLKAGGNFDDLAKQYSKDTGSAAHGGDLDWANLQSYVPEFGAAAAKLQKGQITDGPV